MKLIKLSDTHYIIVDDSEIQEGDYKYHHVKGIIKATCDGAYTNEFKITHSTQPLEFHEYNNCYFFNDIKKISLSEVEEAICGYSVEKMVRTHKVNIKDDWSEASYLVGFNAHKELVKDKLSVNQVIDFYNWLKKSYGSIKPLEEAQIIHRTTPDKIVEMYLQTLKEQTEWNIKFDQNGKIIVV